MTGYCRLK